MIIYFSVIFLLFFLMLIEKKYKHNNGHIIFIIFLLLTLIAALRSFKVGVDTAQYYRNFSVITFLRWNDSGLLRYEIGFFYLCKTLSLITKNPQILIVTTSLFIIPTVGRFIYKNSCNATLSTLLYILLNIYFFHLTGMRQSIAIAILLIAYEFLKNNKKIQFYLLVLLAYSFHSSAIIFILFPFLRKIKYTKNTYFVIMGSTILCFCAYKPIFLLVSKLLGKYSGYTDSELFGVANYYGSFFQFLLVFFIYSICHFINFNKKNNKSVSETDKLYLICVAIAMICQAMAMKMNIIGRVSPYFWIFSILLLPESFVKIRSSKNRFALITIILFIILSYWFIIGIFRPEWNGAIPYSTYFEVIR